MAKPTAIPKTKGRPVGRPRETISGDLEIARGCLAAFALKVVTHALAFIEARDTGALQGRDVHKHILRTVFRLNEAEALLCVEPFYCAVCHSMYCLAYYALAKRAMCRLRTAQ